MKATSIFNYLLIIIAAFPLIGMRITVFTIILWCLTGLFIGVRDKLYLDFFSKWKALLFLSGYYLMAVFSFILISSNYQDGVKHLETKAAFIIFPLIFYLCKDVLKDRIIVKTLISFAISNTLLALYVWLIILNKGLITLFKQDSYYNPIFRGIFDDSTRIHLPYLGLLFGFSILIYIHLLIVKRRKVIYQVCIILSIIILLFSMFIFSARMAIFSTFVGITFYLFKRFSNKRKTIILLTSFFVLMIFLTFLPPIKRRVYVLHSIEFKLPNASQKSHEVNFRYGIYHCSFKVLKEHWLLGLGIGSMQQELNKCYDGYDYSNFDDFKKRQYNCHNQFLNDWLTYGVLGVLFLIFFLGYCFVSGNILHKSFILLITIALFTESLFEREIGVMLFAFFNTLFYTNTQYKINEE